MIQSKEWKSRLSDKAHLVKNYRGEWMIPVECSYCTRKYLMSAKEHGKSGTCACCKRIIHIPFIPLNLQTQCSFCGKRTLTSEGFCECGAML